MAPAEQAGHDDQHKTALNKDLAAVEPVDGIALQRRIGEEAMEEESRGGEIDAEMERLPKMAAQPEPKIGSDDHEREEIESDGADRVFKRLARRMNRVNEVQ